MSAVFGPQDVAALIAAFPPLSSQTEPSLVLTSSGDSLIDFNQVDQRFQSLIRDGTSRISRSDLAGVLNVERDAIPVLLHRLAKQPYFGGNGQSIIPHAEAKDILEKVLGVTESGFVDCVEFSKDLDIDLNDLYRLLSEGDDRGWKRFPSSQGHYVCSDRFLNEVVSEISTSVEAASSEVVDLTATTAKVPWPIVEDVVGEAVKSADGELRRDGERMVFVPSDHQEIAPEDPTELREEQVETYIRELEQRSYCVVEDRRTADTMSGQDDLARAVLSKYDRSHPDGPSVSVLDVTAENVNKLPRRKTAETHSSLVITQEVLRRHIDEVKRSITLHAEQIWLDSEKRISPVNLVLRVQQHRWPSEAEAVLIKVLLCTEYKKEFEEVAQTSIASQEDKDQLTLVELVNDRLVAPMRLYASAIATILDPTLKQNLQTFVLDYFRTHFAGPIGREASAKGLLADKHKSREFDRFQHANQQAITFEELQSSVTKLTRKLKIPSPTSDFLDAVKKRSLRNALRSEIRHSTTASVLLQNTVWILLAQRSEGIFISAGKDTSRMIRQYQAVGDQETTRRLLNWRDLAKAGMTDADALADMRDTARVALQTMYGESATHENGPPVELREA